MRPVVRRETYQPLRDRKAEQRHRDWCNDRADALDEAEREHRFPRLRPRSQLMRDWPVCADNVNVAVPEAAIRRDVCFQVTRMSAQGRSRPITS